MLAPLAGFDGSDTSSDFLQASDDDSFHTPRRTSNSPRPPDYSPTIRTRLDSEEGEMVEESPGADEKAADVNMNGQISAINGVMTTAPASLVPEASDWQVVETPAHDHDHDWENVDAPEQSSFSNNLIFTFGTKPILFSISFWILPLNISVYSSVVKIPS